MSSEDGGLSIGGVGLGYHPLLHKALVARRRELDFIELPLDLYLDAARSALLDPDHARLREISGAYVCGWRGSSLSLGSVENPGDPAHDARLLARIKSLIDEVDAKFWCENLGFGRLADRDLGIAQSMPYTPTAAQWVASRWSAAQGRLDRPVLLEPPASPSLGSSLSPWDAARFLCAVSAAGDCRFVLDVGAFEKFAAEAGADPSDMARRLPRDRISMLAAAGEREQEWRLLAVLLEHTAARTIVIRRACNFFPLEDIFGAARRAKALLVSLPTPAPTPAARIEAPGPVDLEELAGLRAYQMDLIDCCLNPANAGDPSARSTLSRPDLAALAIKARSWQDWKERVEDTHKAQQIARFFFQDA